jgi:hypothetical protein
MSNHLLHPLSDMFVRVVQYLQGTSGEAGIRKEGV